MKLNILNRRNLIFIVILLVMTSVTALGFDNIKTYDAVKREATFKNSFLGIPTTDIAKARLISPDINYVMKGKNRLVAEFEIELYEDNYKDVISKLDFYDIKKDYPEQKIEREFKYKYKTVYQVDIEDYETVCTEKTDAKNGTKVKDCEQKLKGTHKESREQWNDIEKLDLVKGSITIGIFTTVYDGDVIEWVPTIFNLRVSEWAVWVDSFDVGLVSVHTFDNATLEGALNNSFDGRFNFTDNSGGSIVLNTTGCFHNSCVNSNTVTGGERLTLTANIINDLIDGQNNRITISFWGKRAIDTKGNTYGHASFLGTGASGTIAKTFLFGTYYPNNVWSRLNVTSLQGGPGIWDLDVRGTNNTIKKDEWHLYTLQLYNNYVVVYLDSMLSINHSWNYASMTWDNLLLFDGINDDSGERPNNHLWLDELYIWNRTLNSTEISSLYDGGTGTFWGDIEDLEPEVILNAPPSSNYSTSPQTITFNCSAGDDINLANLTWHMEKITTPTSSYHAEVSDIALNLSYQGSVIMTDGVYEYYCRATDTDNNQAVTETRKIIIDSVPPVLDLFYPVNGTIFYTQFRNNTNLSLYMNWTVTDNLELGVCQYNIDGGEYTTVPCQQNSSLLSLGYEPHNITFYANDTSFSVTNITMFDIRYRLWYHNQTYRESSYETTTETYTLALSADNLQTVSASFVFNGEPYTATKTGNNSEMLFSYSMLVPIGNNSFYWNISYGGTYSQTSTIYQYAYPIQFGICSSTLTFPYVNFTFKDESTLAILNATIDTLTVNYGLTNESGKSMTYSNTTTHASYAFCFSLQNGQLETVFDPFYFSVAGYPQRHYYMNQTLTNSTLNKTLYLLSSSTGIYSSIQITNNLGIAISGVTVTVERQISEVSTLIEKGVTDSSGLVTFWLNPNYDHTYKVTKSGYGTSIVTLRPTQSTYTVILTATDSINASYTTPVEGIYYTRTPASGAVNPGVITFTFNITSTRGNMRNCKFELLNKSKSVVETTSSACTTNAFLSFTHTVRNGEIYYGRYYVDMNGTYLLLESDGNWRAINTNSSSMNTLASFLTLLNDRASWGAYENVSSCHRQVFNGIDFDCEAYTDQTTCEADTDCYWGLGDDYMRFEFTMIVIIFFTIALIGAGMNVLFQFDLYHPGYFAMILSVIFFALSISGHPQGLLYIEGATIFPFLDNYVVALYSVIISVIVIIRSKRVGQ